MPQLSIIIVNWNSRDFLKKCLQSIYDNTRGITFEIIVVDGASFDGCGQMLSREFPGAQFIQLEKNVGFARANNSGFERSSGEAVLFLNPDTEIIGDAINVLHDFIEKNPEAGIAGAKLLNTDGSVQASCIQTFPTILNQLLDAEILRRAFPRLSFWGVAPLFDKTPKPVAVEVISGACLLLKRTAFDKIGRFSEDYFLYAEDLDLCYKSNLAGLKNFYVPAAIVTHHGGGSSNQAQGVFSAVMMRESVGRFLKKFRGGSYAAAFRASVALGALVRLLLLAVFYPVRLLQGKAKSGSDAIRRWSAILKWATGCGRSAKDF